MSLPVCGIPPPNISDASWISVRPVAPGLNEELVALWDCEIGLLTHWDKGTWLHKPGGDCKYCSVGKKPEWRGYLIVYPEGGGKVFLLITPRSVYSKLVNIRSAYGTLFGLKLCFSRLAKSRQGLVDVSVVEHQPSFQLDALPRIDPVPYLERLFSRRGS